LLGIQSTGGLIRMSAPMRRPLPAASCRGLEEDRESVGDLSVGFAQVEGLTLPISRLRSIGVASGITPAPSPHPKSLPVGASATTGRLRSARLAEARSVPFSPRGEGARRADEGASTPSLRADPARRNPAGPAATPPGSTPHDYHHRDSRAPGLLRRSKSREKSSPGIARPVEIPAASRLSSGEASRMRPTGQHCGRT
jgi:hypothetical protein